MVKKPPSKEVGHRAARSERIEAEREKTMETLQRGESKYRSLFEGVPVGISLSTLDGRILEINGTFSQMTGYSRAALDDLNARDLYVNPKEREMLLHDLSVSGSVRNYKSQFKRKDGTIFHANSNVSFFASDGEDVLLTAIQDITEQKGVEETLREKEAQYKSIFTSARDGLLIFDLAGNIVEANPQACKMYGYTYDELLTLSGKDIVHPDYKDLFEQFKRAVKGKGEFHAESKDIKKDSTIFILEVRGAEFDYKGKKHLLAIVRDITERKRAEQELQKAFSEVKRLKNRLQAENIYLQEEINLAYQHEEIIGQSHGIKNVLSQAEQVAGTDSTVLILGETGTGKELLARSIHTMSSRKGRTMVKVNCGALPPTLIESELFGREKGAYTGALSKQVGRFEVANGSTIFLDEISELPVEVQAKLLRVLQEGQFERLGSTRTISVAARVIAATNQDLADAVEKGKFREDLYYRLNVFPIAVPPLREHPEDIPLLVWALVKEFGKTMGKRIEAIPRKSMEAMQRYPWPGNVRELRNVIERGMILSKSSTLQVTLPEITTKKIPQNMKLEEIERKHIREVLKRTGWRVRGKNGAANLLGLKPTTLDSRIKKLGIQRRPNLPEIS